MEWFILVLIASMVWPLGNIIDKIFLTKYVKNPFSYQILCGITNGSLIFLLLLFTPVSFTYPWFVLGIIFGIFGWAIFMFYNKAVMTEEISRVVPLMYLNPIFILPLAIIFLNEVLVFSKYLGVLLLVIGAISISYKKLKKTKKSISSAIKSILIFDFLIACYGVMIKYLLGFLDYWSVLFWVNIGGMLGAFLFLSASKMRKNFISDISKLGKKSLVFRYFGSSTYYGGIIPYYMALSIGPVSLITGVNSIQPFFVLLYATIISLFMPKILKEKIDKSIISLKVLAIFLIVSGTWLVIS